MDIQQLLKSWTDNYRILSGDDAVDIVMDIDVPLQVTMGDKEFVVSVRCRILPDDFQVLEDTDEIVAKVLEKFSEVNE